jgi:hypothetical protein
MRVLARQNARFRAPERAFSRAGAGYTFVFCSAAQSS